MDSAQLSQAGAVICLTVLGVLLANAVIIMLVRRKQPMGEIEMMRRLAKEARQPFASDDAKMQELSRRVAELRASERPEEPAETPGEGK